MSPRKAPIRIIGNVVQLIDALAAQGPLSPAAAAERIDIPRSSAYRLIDGLCAIDLLEPVGDGRFRLSPRWLQLSDAARSAMVEWAAAPDLLRRLVETTQQTAYLSVLTGDSATCIEWRRGRGVEVMALRPARSLPLHAGAASRVLLALAADADGYLAGAPFSPLTPHTLVDAVDLRRDIATTRERGYVHSQQDVTIGIDAVGVPVVDRRGRVAGTISLGGLSRAFDGRVPEFVAAARAAAEELGRSLP